jgi:serine/threonine protein kinase
MNKEVFPDYEPISLRGAGAFGYVIEAYDRANDVRVAIKRTHKVGNKLSREYQVLSELKDCEQCVKMLDTFYTVNDEGKVIQNVVFEYVSSNK